MINDFSKNVFPWTKNNDPGESWFKPWGKPAGPGLQNYYNFLTKGTAAEQSFQNSLQPDFTKVDKGAAADMAYENYLPGGNPAMDKALAKLKKAAEPPLSAMTIERANQYLNPITKKPMTPQDYLKYVYDTDNPESKLTSYTRVIDGIPIEFYTWLGLDGMLKDFMKPHGAGTNDAKLGSKAIWGDARLPFETGVIVDPGVAPEENYVPEGWGDFDFGGYGGGGGGGYYGNQYQQDPEVYFNQLVKWVI